MQIITHIPESVMQLPEDCDYMKPVRTSAEISAPNVASLNKQQRMAYDLSLNYITEKEPPYKSMLWEGYAGTGKTYTISELIKTIIIMLHKHVAITAPTNKAVKVLKDMMGMEHNLITFKTIYSLLGLKMDVDEHGKVSFKPDNDPENAPAIDGIDVLVIDEVSMLNDELFEAVYAEVNRRGLRVIFMGDPGQIPPVGKADCIPFVEAYRVKHDIYRVALTEVVRQKQGNPILDLATMVRSNVNSQQVPYEYKTHLTEHGGIIMINRADKDSLYQVCEHYFTNPRFNINPDFMKVIGWTNKTVDFMNTKIRLMLYKSYIRYDDSDTEKKRPMLPKLMIGEKLIADKPILVKVRKNEGWRDTEVSKVAFTTNDEFEVVNYEITTKNVFGNFSVAIYRTVVKSTDENGKVKSETIDIVHESGQEMYVFVQNELKRRALAEKDPYERRQAWRKYYSISNEFAEVKYNYAITAHKSQGSTYDNVIVIEPDIDANPKIVERNRIKYVAYTRSRNLLFIVK